MRISDWSSDVCSSDLSSFPRLSTDARLVERSPACFPRWGQARTGSSFIAAGSAGAGSRLVPAGDIVSCRRRWFHASSAVTARRPVLNPRGVAVRGFWMLLALVVGFPAAAGRDAPADYSRRSGEHTAELQ